MTINPEIDYNNGKAVKAILSEIKVAVKENDITIYKMCNDIGMHKTIWSQFIAWKPYQVSEERIRKVVAYINKRHID